MNQENSRYLRATGPHRGSSGGESPSYLINLPVEVFLNISELLDPVSVNLLALSCKAASVLLAPALERLTPEHLKDFLLSLERDPIIGKHQYFCPGCTKLHNYQLWWGPGVTPCDPWDLRSDDRPWSEARHEVLEFDPSGSGLRLRYDHARLVMNHHLYGPSYGLPLEKLTVSAIPDVDQDIVARQDMTARIINGHLILRCKHSLKPAHSWMSIEDFRYAIDRCFLNVCLHISVYSPPEPYKRVSQLDDQDANNVFFSCHDAIDACDTCCTDFNTAIEVNQDNCSIAIVSYHLMGTCRDPWDPDYPFMFTGNNSYSRNFNKCPSGSVRQMWLDDTKKSVAPTRR